MSTVELRFEEYQELRGALAYAEGAVTGLVLQGSTNPAVVTSVSMLGRAQRTLEEARRRGL